MKLDETMFNAGAKFIAGSNTENRKYPPGTLGFVSHMDNWGDSNQNMILIKAVIIRRGKKGKGRIETDYLSVPVLDIGKEKHDNSDFIHIESLPMEYSNVTEMRPLDFFGWGLANIDLLLKLYKSNDLYNRWPSKNDHPINVMRNIGSHFAYDRSNTIHAFGREDFRNSYINSMRKMQSKLLRPLMMHKAIQSAKIITAISYVIWLYESKDSKGYNKESMRNIYCFSRKENIENRKVVIEMDERRVEENKRKNRGEDSYIINMGNYTAIPVEYDRLIGNFKKLTKGIERNGLSELSYFYKYIFLVS